MKKIMVWCPEPVDGYVDDETADMLKENKIPRVLRLFRPYREDPSTEVAKALIPMHAITRIDAPLGKQEEENFKKEFRKKFR